MNKHRLTHREYQLLEAAKSGIPRRELPARFGLSKNTIRVHLYSAYKKLNIGTYRQFVRKAEWAAWGLQ